MPRVILDSDGISSTNVINLTLDSLIEFLVRYGYQFSRSCVISPNIMKEWWIKQWSQDKVIGYYKKQLNRKDWELFESYARQLPSDLKSRDVNWVILDASWKQIVKRLPVSWWVDAQFKMDRTYPQIEDVIIIEHNALEFKIVE